MTTLEKISASGERLIKDIENHLNNKKGISDCIDILAMVRLVYEQGVMDAKMSVIEDNSKCSNSLTGVAD